MSLIKWEPFGQFNDFFNDISRSTLPKITSDFAIDMYEKGNSVIVEMNIPGIEPDKLDISVEGNHMRVSGSHEEEKENNDKLYYSKEIRRGSFERIITLPAEVKKEDIVAEYKHGRLHIVLPKTDGKKSEKIPITIK